MRELYISEKKIMSTLALHDWGIDNIPFCNVFSECYSPLKNKKQFFNLDFEYTLYQGNYPNDSICLMFPILPQTLGAEVYFLASSKNYMPIALIFMGGAGFPIKYYKRYIDEFETAIQSLATERETWDPFSEQLANVYDGIPLQSKILKRCKPFKKHRFLRVMVIYDMICFLSFTKDDRPNPQGTRYRLAENSDQCIDCYIDGDEVLCFDGWLRTVPPQKSDWKLVAIESDQPMFDEEKTKEKAAKPK